jgi:chloramphenicol 3-O phosphotransferase
MEVVHAHGGYDLEVDTSILSPEQCAELISGRLLEGPPGRRFRELARA